MSTKDSKKDTTYLELKSVHLDIANLGEIPQDMLDELSKATNLNEGVIRTLLYAGFFADVIQNLSEEELPMAYEFARGVTGLDQPTARVIHRSMAYKGDEGKISTGAQDYAVKQASQLKSKSLSDRW